MAGSGCSGRVISMLASGTRVHRFEPGRSHRIFLGVKIFSMHSFGREVKPFAPCRRFAARKRTLLLHGSWVTGKICRPFLARFPPTLVEVPTLVRHGVPLELTEETKERSTEGKVQYRPRCIQGYLATNQSTSTIAGK
jgi:hypothetical protein